MKKLFLIFCIAAALLPGCSNNIDYLPEDFFGLKLAKTVRDDDASRFVNKLHFKTVTSQNNKIGFYEGEPGSAIIYLTIYDDEESAASEAGRMIEKISPGKTLFTDGEFIKINDETVYQCFGMGKSHFVFTKDSVLFWISIDTYFAKRFLADYLDYLS
jgi:hypothetical protein